MAGLVSTVRLNVTARTAMKCVTTLTADVSLAVSQTMLVTAVSLVSYDMGYRPMSVHVISSLSRHSSLLGLAQ